MEKLSVNTHKSLISVSYVLSWSSYYSSAKPYGQPRGRPAELDRAFGRRMYIAGRRRIACDTRRGRRRNQKCDERSSSCGGPGHVQPSHIAIRYSIYRNRGPAHKRRTPRRTIYTEWPRPRGSIEAGADLLDDVADSLQRVHSGNLALRAIKSPVLNRFRYIGTRNAFHPRKIRNGARNFENAMICARR